MRVAIITEQVFAPVPGGTGRYARELWRALQRTAAAEDSTQAWSAWHRAAEMAAQQARDVRRLPLGRRPLIAAWERGLGPRPGNADVVHATTLLAPKASVPLVVTIHDVVPWTHPQTLTPRGVRWHLRMAERVVAAGAHIAVPTEAVAQGLLAVGLGLDPDRVHVLGAGVSETLATPPSAPERAAVSAELDLPARFLLTLATFEPRKGLGTLFDALGALGAQAPPLLLVGQPGWGGLDPAAEAARRGLPPAAVRVLSSVTDRQLAVVLRAAQALVMPSLAEGFGLPVAEAMAAGTAVICSDDPALVEVAGPAARVVGRGQPAELAAAIAELWADEAQRTALAKAGLERAPQFTWDAVADRSWRLYRLLRG
jgi:glycosyltransferase involved in cell wall biosynthesis